MNQALFAVQIVGVLLSAPAALLAYTDWRHRRATYGRLAGASTTSAPSAGTTWAPPPVDASAPTRPGMARPGATACRPVSIPRRILSALIDLYASLILAVLIGGALSGGESFYAESMTGADLVGLTAVLFGYAAITASTGRSLGRLLVGARLERVDGTSLSTVRVAVRCVLALFASCAFITYFVALSGEDRRTLHDRLAGTRAVRTR